MSNLPYFVKSNDYLYASSRSSFAKSGINDTIAQYYSSLLPNIILGLSILSFLYCNIKSLLGFN